MTSDFLFTGTYYLTFCSLHRNMIFDGPDGGPLMSIDVRDPWRKVSVGTSGQSGELFSVQHPQCERKTGCGNDKLHFHVILTDV